MEISGIKQNSTNYTNTSSLAAVQTARVEQYADEIEEALDILEEYAEEIEPTILAYNRSSVGKTMALTLLRNSTQRGQNRKTHQEMVKCFTKIAVQEMITQKNMRLHPKAAAIMAENHDLGHTPLGHDGEKMLNEIKAKYGLGIYTHNALGPKELMYRYKAPDEIIEIIKILHPEKSEEELKRVEKSLWVIMDGINSHNGERSEMHIIPDKTKTAKKMEEEIMKCHTIPGFDRTFSAATPEGCIVALCDIIAYTPFDMVDMLYEGLLPSIEGTHKQILLDFGITNEEIAEANARKFYDVIARKIQIILTKSLIENSTSSRIALAPETAELMYKFRKANQDIIFAEKDKKSKTGIYPNAIENLMLYYAYMIENNIGIENLRTIKENKFFAKALMNQYGKGVDEEFIRFITGTTPEIYDFNERMLREAENSSSAEIKLPFESKMAMEFAAEYLSTLNDHLLVKIARSKKIISERENKEIRKEYRSQEDQDSDANAQNSNIPNAGEPTTDER